jgi:hypothetical protein
MTSHAARDGQKSQGDNMLGKLIPQRLKTRMKAELHWQGVDILPELMPELMQFAHFIPHQPRANSYTLPAYPTATEFHPTSSLPVPPSSLWANYGTSVADYLESGEDDVKRMRQILTQSGPSIETAERILELGCAAGRMIRWLVDLDPVCEIWGVDIWATAILWCKEHLKYLHKNIFISYP